MIITHKWLFVNISDYLSIFQTICQYFRLFVNISDYLSIFQKLARMVDPLHRIGFAIAKTLQNAICISATPSDYEISLF